MRLLYNEEKDFLKLLEEKEPNVFNLLKDNPAGLQTYFRIHQLLKKEEVKQIIAGDAKQYVFSDFDKFASTDPEDFRKFIAVNTVLFEAVTVFPTELQLFIKALVMPECQKYVGRNATLLISQKVFETNNENTESAIVQYLSIVLDRKIVGFKSTFNSKNSVVFTISSELHDPFSNSTQSFNAEFGKILEIILREGCQKLKRFLTFSNCLIDQPENAKEYMRSKSFKRYGFCVIQNTIHFYTIEKSGNVKEELFTDFSKFVEKINSVNANLQNNNLRRYNKEIKQHFKMLIDGGQIDKAKSYVSKAKEFGFDEYVWDLIEAVCDNNPKNEFDPWLYESCLTFSKESLHFERAQNICSELLCDPESKISKPKEKLAALEAVFILLHNSKNINDNQLRARECFIELCGFPMLSNAELYVHEASAEQLLKIAKKFRELNKIVSASLEKRVGNSPEKEELFDFKNKDTNQPVVPEQKIINQAMSLFKGDGTKDNPSHSDFKTWYHPDIFHYLSQMINNQAQCVQVIFEDAGDGKNINTFKSQLECLITLSGYLNKPALFISKEPGAENHFICGLVKGNQLLFINPLGITKQDACYQTLAELQQKKVLNKIWLSSSPLQRREYEEEGLVSCGPISLELAMHILSEFTLEQLNEFWSALTSNEPTQHEASGLIYFGMSIKRLLPDGLKGLLTCVDSSLYQKRMCAIRERHGNALEMLAKQRAHEAGISIPDYLNHCRDSASAAQLVFEDLHSHRHDKETYDIQRSNGYLLLKQELEKLEAKKDENTNTNNSKFSLSSSKLTLIEEEKRKSAPVKEEKESKQEIEQSNLNHN